MDDKYNEAGIPAELEAEVSNLYKRLAESADMEMKGVDDEA